MPETDGQSVQFQQSYWEATAAENNAAMLHGIAGETYSRSVSESDPRNETGFAANQAASNPAAYGQPASPNPVPPQGTSPHIAPPPRYSPELIRTKDHVVAGLLALFLGAFGLHKIYLGYMKSGFLMLAITVIGGILTIGVAAGVMQVIAFVESIIYLTKSQSEFEREYVFSIREWF